MISVNSKFFASLVDKIANDGYLKFCDIRIKKNNEIYLAVIYDVCAFVPFGLFVEIYEQDEFEIV